jgi:hypothetical protein
LGRPDLHKARELAAELVALAEEHGGAELIAEAANWLAFARMVSGDFELADQSWNRAWALLESKTESAKGRSSQLAGLIPLPLSQASNRMWSAWNLWFLGYPERALARVNVATAIAQ